MDVFLQAYNNFKKNDLQTCKKVGNVVGIFFLVCNFLQSLLFLAKANLAFWIVLTVCSISMGYILGYVIGIVPAIILYYFVELISPRKEKSYLPNEQKEQ
jgi:hypothetical protein